MNEAQLNKVIGITAHLANIEDVDAFVEKHSKFVFGLVGTNPAVVDTSKWTDEHAKKLEQGLTDKQRLILKFMHSSGNRVESKDIHNLLLTKGGYTKIGKATLPGIFSGITKKSEKMGMTKPFGWELQGGTWHYVIYADAYQHLKKYL